VIKFVATINYNIGRSLRSICFHLCAQLILFTEYTCFFENLAILPVEMKVHTFMCF